MKGRLRICREYPKPLHPRPGFANQAPPKRFAQARGSAEARRPTHISGAAKAANWKGRMSSLIAHNTFYAVAFLSRTLRRAAAAACSGSHKKVLYLMRISCSPPEKIAVLQFPGAGIQPREDQSRAKDRCAPAHTCASKLWRTFAFALLPVFQARDEERRNSKSESIRNTGVTAAFFSRCSPPSVGVRQSQSRLRPPLGARLPPP